MTNICVIFSTVYNDTLVAKGLDYNTSGDHLYGKLLYVIQIFTSQHDYNFGCCCTLTRTHDQHLHFAKYRVSCQHTNGT